MSAPLVSIIIPFYNEERYLERAVRSALQQSYQPLEIILVDDGSDDGSPVVAGMLAQQQERVLLHSIAHHSIGRARNIGVQQASGTYIAYLDSDDELEPDAIEKLVAAMEGESIDFVSAGFNMCSATGEQLSSNDHKGLASKLDAREAGIALCKERIARVVWAKLFRADICRKIAFPEGIWFEDGPYLMAYFSNCKGAIAISDRAVVKHYCRPDSVTRQQISAKRITDTFKAFEAELETATAHSSDEYMKTQLFSYYQRALMNNLVMLVMDRKQVSDDLQNRYLEVFSAFLHRKNKEKVRLGPRTRMNIVLMNSPALMGWGLFYIIFPVLKSGLFRKIAAIRAFGKA